MAQHSPVQRRLAAEDYESWLDEVADENDRCPKCNGVMFTAPTIAGAISECEECGHYIESDYDPDPTYDVRVRT